METNNLSISKDCWLEMQRFDNGKTIVYLNYIEHAQEYGFMDEETSIEITEENISSIISFLKDTLSTKGDQNE